MPPSLFLASVCARSHMLPLIITKLLPKMKLIAICYRQYSCKCLCISAVDYFSAKHISAGVLQRMLKKPEVEVAEHPGSHIYQRGKASDFFCLILQGQVKVQMGQENITFHGGPFTYFGTGAFSGNRLFYAHKISESYWLSQTNDPNNVTLTFYYF